MTVIVVYISTRTKVSSILNKVDNMQEKQQKKCKCGPKKKNTQVSTGKRTHGTPCTACFV